MYVATMLDKSWLLSVQRKLYKQSQQDPDYIFEKLWGFVTDLRNLRMAFQRVSRNKGSRTAGVDGVTVRIVLRGGVDVWLESLRKELRDRRFQPSPVRRVWLPKPGQPGKFRPLGIPTLKDRVVQATLKNVLEPIFEAGFYPCSYGFRPGKSVHGALTHVKALLKPKNVPGHVERVIPYPWAIEGDIKGCFDAIDHHALMQRVRRRIGDTKVSRAVLDFLRAGVLSESQLLRTDAGTPQGGILSPLLANIALGSIEERYQRHVWPNRYPALVTDPRIIRKRADSNRYADRKAGRRVLYPIRYADDFLLLADLRQEANAPAELLREKESLARDLKNDLGLELSESKTLITEVTTSMRFLGHQVRVLYHPTHRCLESKVLVPKDRSRRVRWLVKGLFRRNMTLHSLENRLRALNPILRGWGNFYRHAWKAKRVFADVDRYVWWVIFRWLQKKHPNTNIGTLVERYGWRKPNRRSYYWRENGISCFRLSSIRVHPYQFGWERVPDFAVDLGEPGA